MVSLDGVAKDELVLLGLSLKSPKYMDFFESHGGLESITPEKLKELFTQVVAKYRQEPSSFDKLAHLVVSQVKNPEKIVSLINISSPNTEGLRDFHEKNSMKKLLEGLQKIKKNKNIKKTSCDKTITRFR